MSKKTRIFIFAALSVSLLFSSCSVKKQTDSREHLVTLLQDETLAEESRFSVINQIAQNMLNSREYHGLIVFLTNYINSHQDDRYNSYWLLMTAYSYQKLGNEAVAERYFERIIKNYDDLIVKNNSVHLLCLQNLIQISTNPQDRVDYFTRLLTEYPDEVNRTELLVRLAVEYEKLGEWTQSLKSYSDFLERSDAAEIQIAGIPSAYADAKYLIDFNKSSKDWTFETLDDLVASVKRGISWYDYNTLDKYRSKVNFFSMSWRQSQDMENSIANFSMRDFMQGNRIRYNADLDNSTTPNEAYLRTWGWSSYVNVWYLYFRKVNFPIDPEIHGRWEWAGIYFGEKL